MTCDVGVLREFGGGSDGVTDFSCVKLVVEVIMIPCVKRSNRISSSLKHSNSSSSCCDYVLECISRGENQRLQSELKVLKSGKVVSRVSVLHCAIYYNACCCVLQVIPRIKETGNEQDCGELQENVEALKVSLQDLEDEREDLLILLGLQEVEKCMYKEHLQKEIGQGFIGLTKHEVDLKREDPNAIVDLLI